MPDTPIVIAVAAVIVGLTAALIARVRRAGGGHGQSSDSAPVDSGSAWVAGGLFGGHSDRDRADDDRSGSESDSGGRDHGRSGGGGDSGSWSDGERGGGGDSGSWGGGGGGDSGSWGGDGGGGDSGGGD